MGPINGGLSGRVHSLLKNIHIQGIGSAYEGLSNSIGTPVVNIAKAEVDILIGSAFFVYTHFGK